MLKGKHLISGAWIAGDKTFTNDPVSGDADTFAMGNVELVNAACEAAEDAFWSFGQSACATRATFLRCIAEEIDRLAD
ncbi:hypothetical protein [Ruegeria arenilitoris]|uniref:hypothetical protein n=1 Tax=Ruegeria arenilitoris TaxID=1173585 RepID=UPI00147C5C4D|nr:hypothetical protein [Ruegeria arenilitoris]